MPFEMGNRANPSCHDEHATELGPLAPEERMVRSEHPLFGVSLVALAACLTACGSESTAGKPAPAAATLEPGCKHTKFEGDELCIAPPPSDKGFQVHIGPSDYDNPDEVAPYMIKAGAELTQNYFLKSANDQDIYYYRRQYRMRPGSHHMIVSAIAVDHPDGWDTAPTASGDAGTSAAPPVSGGFGDIGRRLGGSQNESKDNPVGEIPPEDVGIGMPLAAHTQLSINLHHYNGSERDRLREEWVNFWYVDPNEVTQQATEMFAVGGYAMAVAPGEHPTLHYTCPVSEDGRVLEMYGHRHAHNVRFSAWRTRGDQRDLVYDGFNWKDPLVLEFSSVTTNPTPDDATKKEGGWSGILDLKKDDIIEWECEVVNDGSTTLHFTNETVNGEMCILVGDTIGPTIACPHP